ncbi:MAG: hypothetical protein C4331_08760 [Meiothermus sp.]
MARESVDGVDTVLLTHAHNDHILGLGDLADRARWTQQPCPRFAPAEASPQIAGRFPYMTQEGSAYLKWMPMSALEGANRRFGGAHRHPRQSSARVQRLVVCLPL